MTPERIEIIEYLVTGSLFLAFCAGVILFGIGAIWLSLKNDSNERKS